MESNKLRKNDPKRNWGNMDENLLLRIFMGLNMVDWIIRVSGVCRSWRKVSHEPSLWRNMDVTKLMDAFSEPNNDDFLSRGIIQNLGDAVAHSRGNVTSFIGITYLDLNVPSWVFIAERTPLLRKLVLPSMTLWGFCEAVKRWPLLESLVAVGVTESRRVLKAIGENCTNFSQLKLQGLFDLEVANSIVTYVPKLKVLSLRGSLVYKEALNLILSKLEHLELLNISHCLLVNSIHAAGLRTSIPKLDDLMLERTAKPIRLILCVESSCPECSHVMRHYRGISRWYDYYEGFWKNDEISTFNS